MRRAQVSRRSGSSSSPFSPVGGNIADSSLLPLESGGTPRQKGAGQKHGKGGRKHGQKGAQAGKPPPAMGAMYEMKSAGGGDGVVPSPAAASAGSVVPVDTATNSTASIASASAAATSSDSVVPGDAAASLAASLAASVPSLPPTPTATANTLQKTPCNGGDKDDNKKQGNNDRRGDNKQNGDGDYGGNNHSDDSCETTTTAVPTAVVTNTAAAGSSAPDASAPPAPLPASKPPSFPLAAAGVIGALVSFTVVSALIWGLYFLVRRRKKARARAAGARFDIMDPRALPPSLFAPHSTASLAMSSVPRFISAQEADTMHAREAAANPFADAASV